MSELCKVGKTCLSTAGKIIIEHVTIFLSKYIYKGEVDITFSPDVSNNPSNPHKTKHTSSEIESCVIKLNDTGGKLLNILKCIASHKSICR